MLKNRQDSAVTQSKAAPGKLEQLSKNHAPKQDKALPAVTTYESIFPRRHIDYDINIGIHRKKIINNVAYDQQLLLARVIPALGVALHVFAVKQHFLELSPGKHLGLVGKMRRRGIAALAAHQDAARLQARAKLHHLSLIHI